MITSEELRELLSYEPDTGQFVWRVNPRKNYREIGQIAGSRSVRGYRIIRIRGRNYPSHRLAWLYMTGSFPENEIDHKNMVRDDNRFCNLREATHGQNQANGNGWAKSGMKGAYPNPESSTWIALICGKYLGSFKTKEEAHLAYCAAAQEQHGQYFRR